MIVYKVVTCIEPGIYESAIWHRHILYYRIGYWTFPRFGKIFAFDTLESARTFARSEPYHKVFKADASGIADVEFVVNVFKDEYFEDYWKGGFDALRGAPKGTIACDALKLLGEV